MPNLVIESSYQACPNALHCIYDSKIIKVRKGANKQKNNTKNIDLESHSRNGLRKRFEKKIRENDLRKRLRKTLQENNSRKQFEKMIREIELRKRYEKMTQENDRERDLRKRFEKNISRKRFTIAPQ